MNIRELRLEGLIDNPSNGSMPVLTEDEEHGYITRDPDWMNYRYTVASVIEEFNYTSYDGSVSSVRAVQYYDGSFGLEDEEGYYTVVQSCDALQTAVREHKQASAENIRNRKPHEITEVVDTFYKTNTDGRVALVRTWDGQYHVGWGLAAHTHTVDSHYCVYSFPSYSEARSCFDKDYADECYYNR